MAGRLCAQSDTVAVQRSQQRAPSIEKRQAADAPKNVFSPQDWRRVDAAVDRGLAFLATQQQPDGSFPTNELGQPAVTSLCVLAFMAHGHNPGTGQYGARLEKAVDFIVACQKPNGLVTRTGPDGPTITRNTSHVIGVTAAYNHTISSLALAEVYGMCPTKRSPQIQRCITKAVAATLQMQQWPKDLKADIGGWRYIDDYDRSDSDLSITGWQLMFLRSARNAGFPVPKEAIDNGVRYIRNTFSKEYGTFVYAIEPDNHRSRAMAGAGILALGHAGFHNSVEAQTAGKWLLKYSFEVYNDSSEFSQHDPYHYSLFACCQGMYQLGSPYWEQFFPRTARAVLKHQQANGSWEPERLYRDTKYGNSYTTALAILALGAPNQLLPVFQR
jgi:hypothetical protein